MIGVVSLPPCVYRHHCSHTFVLAYAVVMGILCVAVLIVLWRTRR